MSVTLSIDERNFQDMLDFLNARMRVEDYDTILMNEVKSVLVSATKKTKKASKKVIRQHIISTIPDKNSPGWYKPTGHGARMRKWRVKDSEWAAYKRYKQAQIKELQSRVGLSAQSWVEIGKELGIQVPAPGYVLKAKVNGSPVKHRVSGTRKQSGPKQVSYTLLYQNPSGAFAGARNALQSAIRGRVSYFKRNLREGVFHSARDTAAKYPGITATRN